MHEKASVVARGLFAIRPLILLLFAVATAFLAWSAKDIRVNTDVRKMVPLDHPYIQNFLAHRDDVPLGNDIRIIVEDVAHPDIFNETYMTALHEITDDVFAMPGVDPSAIRSLWTPSVRWSEVTAEGFQGGEVIPPGYDGGADALEALRTNVLRSGQVGRLVADDFRSSIVHAELMDVLAEDSGFDIPTLNAALEDLRARYEERYPSVRLHIVGTAKQVGEVIEAAEQVALFFLVTIVLTAALLLIDTRCLRSSTIVIFCSIAAVVWQLGIITLMGLTIDPYSMLVPFLVFAIAVSHGVQIVNRFLSELTGGAPALDAARATFAALALPGIIALVSDGIGFLTLYIIDIGVIRELAISASIGVAVVILTNLVIVPMILSWTGARPQAVARVGRHEEGGNLLVAVFGRFTGRSWAIVSILLAVFAYGAGLWYSQDLRIGDLDKGAPELWPDPCSERECERGYRPAPRYQYNHDVNFLVEHYSVSADVLVVMAQTGVESCNTYEVMQTIDDLAWALRVVPGVQDVLTIASATRMISSAMNEGSPKWATISRDQFALNNVMPHMPNALYNMDCSVTPLYVFLDDHKAETLARVTERVEAFKAQQANADVVEFKLASGNSGIEAATNQTIEASQYPMLALVYGVVIALCLIAFRSLRAVMCIIIPLGLTSVLCQALMTWLGIGVKVATLPVIALGVGIGVDYGIYIYSRLADYMKQGMELEDAWRETLKTTGKAVAFTGLALALGVILWVFSSIKFQADMGILLTFMFLWNMIGALWLLPALASFLLRTKQGAQRS